METTSLDFQTPFEPDYKEQPMILQLMKIEDSIGNPKPLTHVRTDDGDEVFVGEKAAKTLLKLFRHAEPSSKFDTVFNPEMGATRLKWKRNFLRNIQYTKGLTMVLDKVNQMYK